MTETESIQIAPYFGVGRVIAGRISMKAQLSVYLVVSLRQPHT